MLIWLYAFRSSIQQNFNGSGVAQFSDIHAEPEYFPRNGDLHLVFLSGNGVRFQAPVDDLWYRATIPTKPFETSGVPGPLPDLHAYRPDEPASPMACFQQYQFCAGAESRCGPLSSWADAQVGASEIFGFKIEDEDAPPDNHSASRFYWFVGMLTYSAPDLTMLLTQLGANSLASMRSLYGSLMGPLSSDQWQVDVMQWWAMYLAGVQGAVVSTSAGPVDTSVEHLRIEPYNQWIHDHVCTGQVSSLFLWPPSPGVRLD